MIRTKFLSFLLLAACAAPLVADVPSKPAISSYKRLWDDSLFTTKPIVDKAVVEAPNPLEDFTLAGVGKVKDGWYVVLINKKDRNDRVRIKPGEANDKGFQVVNVRPGAKYKETRVEIKSGSRTGWVEYDDKFLVLKKAAPARQPQQGKPGQPPKPGQAKPPTPAAKPPTPSGSGGRPTRVRRVPTPPSRGR